MAIGREGQNVRLAAKLTGWKIDVRSPEEAGVAEKEAEKEVGEEKTDEESKKEKEPKPKKEIKKKKTSKK